MLAGKTDELKLINGSVDVEAEQLPSSIRPLYSASSSIR